LLLSDSPSTEAKARLHLLEQTTDGFKLAEEDLKLRGPGDYFGTRQSGKALLQHARLTDTALLECARADAMEIVGADPALTSPELAELRRRVAGRAATAGEAN
jgi:ATP-dependent DNA helicase RecG